MTRPHEELLAPDLSAIAEYVMPDIPEERSDLGLVFGTRHGVDEFCLTAQSLALASVRGTADEVLHVGDELLTDIAGRRTAGIPTALVGTGKYAEGRPSRNSCNDGYFLRSSQITGPVGEY
jgi:phosphoglycolate phosphatase-like HAD superfamily hydrolase